MDEFSVINRFFKEKQNTAKGDGVILGIGDDSAIVKTDNNQALVVCTDTLISGTHFDNDYNAEDIAYRALAVNLSDIAAMGATPRWFTLALTLKNIDTNWLRAFSDGLFKLANQHQLTLVGGDTTKGDLSITIQVIGETHSNGVLKRSGAKIGDDIYVSNTIGNAALALQGEKKLLSFLHRPTAQIKLGQALAGIANSCIDISDGLSSDLNHILTASDVGASIDVLKIPLSKTVASYIKKNNDYALLLNGGDDYQLCFTASKKKRADITKIAEKLATPLTKIGHINQDKKLIIKGYKQQKPSGYKHF